eukprot:g29489.t1
MAADCSIQFGPGLCTYLFGLKPCSPSSADQLASFQCTGMHITGKQEWYLLFNNFPKAAAAYRWAALTCISSETH